MVHKSRRARVRLICELQRPRLTATLKCIPREGSLLCAKLAKLLITLCHRGRKGLNPRNKCSDGSIPRRCRARRARIRRFCRRERSRAWARLKDSTRRRLRHRGLRAGRLAACQLAPTMLWLLAWALIQLSCKANLGWSGWSAGLGPRRERELGSAQRPPCGLVRDSGPPKRSGYLVGVVVSRLGGSPREPLRGCASTLQQGLCLASDSHHLLPLPRFIGRGRKFPLPLLRLVRRTGLALCRAMASRPRRFLHAVWLGPAPRAGEGCRLMRYTWAFGASSFIRDTAVAKARFAARWRA